MSELMPDALFGFDGTESSELRLDPSGRGDPGFSPLTLPVIPIPGMTREAIAARLEGDHTRLMDQHPGSSPEQRPAAAPSASRSHTPQAHAPSEHVRAANALAAHVLSAQAPSAPVTAPLLAHAAEQLGDPSAAIAPDHSRPHVPAPIPPGKLSPPRRSTMFFRPSLAVGSRIPVRLGDLRRRVVRQDVDLPSPLWSSGGAGAFFFIALVIFFILAYGIVAGIVESVIRLFQ